MLKDSDIFKVAKDVERYVQSPPLRAGQAVVDHIGLVNAHRQCPKKNTYKFCESDEHFAYAFYKIQSAKTGYHFERLHQFISSHADKFSESRLGRSPWLTFKYFPEAYSAPSQNDSMLFPIMRTEWCDGKTLSDFLRSVARTAETSPQTAIDLLDKTCHSFLQLLKVMHEIKMAHGDLSGRNIMVEGDSNNLVLLEYDLVYFPDEEKRQSLDPESLQLATLQHPGARDKSRIHNERMDDFSAFVIMLALYAIKAELGMGDSIDLGSGETLCDLLGDNERKDALLFTQEDLKSPESSEVFASIRDLEDDDLTKLVNLVQEYCRGSDSNHVPRFAPTMEKLFDPHAKLRSLANQQPRDWEAIGAEDNRLMGLGLDLPDDLSLKTIVWKARDHHKAISHLRKAIEKEPPSARQIIEAWNNAKHEYYEWRTEIQRAQRQIEILNTLDKTLASDPGYRETVNLYESKRRILSACEENRQWKQNVKKWKKQIAAADALLPLIKSEPPWASDIAVAEAWKSFVAAGGHPDFDSVRDELEPLILNCVARATAIKCVREILESSKIGANHFEPDETFDRKLLGCWNDELLSECVDVQTDEKELHTAAKKRVAIIDLIDTKLSELEESGQGSEAQIAKSAINLPKGYSYNHSRRVKLAQLRNQRYDALQDAIKEPISDIRLSQAYEEFQDAWGECSHAPRFSSKTQQRIKRAAERLLPLQLLLQSIRQTPDETDQCETDDLEICEHWDRDLFAEPLNSIFLCADAQAVYPRVMIGIARIKAVANIRSTIKEIDQLRTRRNVDTSQADKGESSIVQQVQESELTETYLQQLQQNTYKRIEQARRRADIFHNLMTSINADQPLDSDIARDWENLDRVGGDPRAARHKARGRLACVRRDGLIKLRKLLASADSLDNEDHSLLAIWRDHQLDACTEAIRYRSRKDFAWKRASQWRLLEKAIRADEHFEIMEHFVSPLNVFYPPVREQITVILKAISTAKPAKDFLATLQGDSPQEIRVQFAKLFSHEHFQNYPEHCVSFLEEIKDRKKELFDAYSFTSNNVYAPEALNNKQIRVHWNWRNDGHYANNVISHAVVMASPKPIKTLKGEIKAEGIFERIKQDNYQRHDSSCILGNIPDAWNENPCIYLAAWPEIVIACGTHSFTIQPDRPHVTYTMGWPPKQQSKLIDEYQPLMRNLINKFFSLNEK